MCVSEHGDVIHSPFFIYVQGSASFRVSICEFPVNYFSMSTNQKMFVAAQTGVMSVF